MTIVNLVTVVVAFLGGTTQTLDCLKSAGPLTLRIDDKEGFLVICRSNGKCAGRTSRVIRMTTLKDFCFGDEQYPEVFAFETRSGNVYYFVPWEEEPYVPCPTVMLEPDF